MIDLSGFVPIHGPTNSQQVWELNFCGQRWQNDTTTSSIANLNVPKHVGKSPSLDLLGICGIRLFVRVCPLLPHSINDYFRILVVDWPNGSLSESVFRYGGWTTNTM